MKHTFLKTLKSFLLIICTIVIPLSFIGCGENSDDDVDIDLSKMSTTMMYSYISNMIDNPDDSIGKTVKAKGVHDSFTDENTNITYHAILIYDSTTCCSQALEFILAEDSNYPAKNKNITIEGTFGTYNEGNNTYCYLNPSKVV